jgi:hypothetical protein
LTADLSEFEAGTTAPEEALEEMEDSLLELLRQGTTLQQSEFLAELRRQRSGETVAS